MVRSLQSEALRCKSHSSVAEQRRENRKALAPVALLGVAAHDLERLARHLVPHPGIVRMWAR